MTITVKIKNVYGNDTIYPVCAMAQGFANLLKQKTLTLNDCHKIKAMGFAIIGLE